MAIVPLAAFLQRGTVVGNRNGYSAGNQGEKRKNRNMHIEEEVGGSCSAESVELEQGVMDNNL